MAGFKKFIVSGSNASLNHIAAGNNLDTTDPVAGGISASALYAFTQDGGDVSGDMDKIVVVNPTTNEYVTIQQSDIVSTNENLSFNTSDFDGTNGTVYDGGTGTTISVDVTNLGGDGLGASAGAFQVQVNSTLTQFNTTADAVNLISSSIINTNFGLTANAGDEGMTGLPANAIGVKVDQSGNDTITVDNNGLAKSALAGAALTDGNGIMNNFTYTVGGASESTIIVDTGSLAGVAGDSGLSTYEGSGKIAIKTGSISPTGFYAVNAGRSLQWHSTDNIGFITASILENSSGNSIALGTSTKNVFFNARSTEFKGTTSFKHESVIEIADDFLLINSKSLYDSESPVEFGFQGSTGSHAPGTDVGRRWGFTGSADGTLSGRWQDLEVLSLNPGSDDANAIGGMNLWCSSNVADVAAYAAAANNYIKQTGNMISDTSEDIYMYVA